jgi:HEAT repeat protein
VYLVAGVALQDPSYETRQAIARCLGQIGMNETKGPNVKALQALAGNLAKDESVAVRMEALQALVMLGPPWETAKKAGDKTPPKINQKAADFVADAMRARLGIGMGKTKTKEVEMDKQLEIWCRVVLMRFDPMKEINDENLGAIARHCSAKDDGPKVQALQALAIFGEQAAPKVDSVVSTLDSDNPLVLSTALSALASMGVKAEGAIPELEKQEKRWLKIREDKMIENLKDKKFAEAYDKLMQKEKDQVIASMPQEQVRLTIASTIKWIKDSKPGMPGGDRKEPEKK